ncbi:MAG: site-2 protease family protein [Helicobacteraceae bacterium]|jgi:Zn-dependent protease|nr:site-2 protease family protein [Helicobacteraceae bacterium]
MSFHLVEFLAMIAALLIAVIGHEIMHGLAAFAFGDRTAKDAGRLSVNPARHIDPLGTIVLPLVLYLSGTPFLFGWAKPVPIDGKKVLERGGHKAMVVVALAGVAFNLLLAFVAAQFLNEIAPASELNKMPFLDQFISYLIIWNVILAVFNLLPIPPLDGSNALAHICAYFGIYSVGRFFARIGMWGMVILIVILMTDLKLPIFWLMEAILSLII